MLENKIGSALSDFESINDTFIVSQIGKHNYCGIGAFDAAKLVTSQCPSGYRCVWKMPWDIVDKKLIQVGQVSIHKKNKPIPLYIKKINEVV